MNKEDAQRLIEEHWSNKPGADELFALNVEKWNPGGTNPKFLATSTSGRKWIVKYCKNDASRIPEICEREVLVSLIGKAITVPVVEAWTIKTSEINIDPIEITRFEREVIREKAVLLPHLVGSTIEQDRVKATEVVKNFPERIADLFAFMYWIGDEDRGLADVLVVEDQITLIDNGLCGPNIHSYLRGYHPFHDAFPYDRRVKMCFTGKPSLVAFILRDCRVPVDHLQSPAAIDRIERIEQAAIESFSLSLKLSQYVGKKLFARISTLREEYKDWLLRAAIICK